MDPTKGKTQTTPTEEHLGGKGGSFTKFKFQGPKGSFANKQITVNITKDGSPAPTPWKLTCDANGAVAETAVPTNDNSGVTQVQVNDLPPAMVSGSPTWYTAAFCNYNGLQCQWSSCGS